MPGTALAARPVAMLAPMTFLENLEIDAEGNIVMTSLLDGRIWRVPFGGQPELITQVQGRPSGIAAAPDEGWLAFGWTVSGTVAAFHITPDGASSVCAEFPEAIFPNGAQRMPNGRYLFADSVTATIWELDYATGTVQAWCRSPLFAPKEGAWEPALNGLKVWGDTLYMSNSSTAQFLSMRIKDGRPDGEPQVVRSDLHADDFAFDEEGSAYITTHPLDVVLKLTQGGELTKVAGAAEGVRGCTACRFGRKPGDETGLYVVADGGLLNPASGGLQPARVVRLETGKRGAPVDLL
jgi:hypothetical protein